MKVIIFTTRLIDSDDINDYKNNNWDKDKTIEVCGREIQYFIKCLTNNGKLILLDGTSIAGGNIDITELKEGNQNNKCEIVKCFLEMLKEIAKEENFDLQDLIFVIHWGREPRDKSEKYTENFRKWIKKCSNNDTDFLVTYWTTQIGEDRQLIEKLKKGNFDEINFQEILQRYQNRAKNLTELLHRIAYLFLPLDIDLQGISEVLKREDKTQAKEYYKEAFGNNGKGIVQNKIKEAEKLIKELPDDKRNDIFKLFKDDELERVKKSLENWEGTKQLLQKENPFHSWFCKLMKCLKNLGEE